MRALFDFDPVTRTREIFHYDETTDDFYIESQQDVESTAEDAKAEFRQFDERTPWKGDMHKVASIPMTLYMELVKSGVASDEKAFRRWLDDPDNRVFRTRPGRLSR